MLFAIDEPIFPLPKKKRTHIPCLICISATFIYLFFFFFFFFTGGLRNPRGLEPRCLGIQFTLDYSVPASGTFIIP